MAIIAKGVKVVITKNNGIYHFFTTFSLENHALLDTRSYDSWVDGPPNVSHASSVCRDGPTITLSVTVGAYLFMANGIQSPKIYLKM